MGFLADREPFDPRRLRRLLLGALSGTRGRRWGVEGRDGWESQKSTPGFDGNLLRKPDNVNPTKRKGMRKSMRSLTRKEIEISLNLSHIDM